MADHLLPMHTPGDCPPEPPHSQDRVYAAVHDLAIVKNLIEDVHRLRRHPDQKIAALHP
jgi:hypothetical protein